MPQSQSKQSSERETFIKQIAWYQAVTDALTYNLHSYLRSRSSLITTQDRREVLFPIVNWVSILYRRFKQEQPHLKPSKWMRSVINWSIHYQQSGVGQPSDKDMRDAGKDEIMDVTLPDMIPKWAGPIEEQYAYPDTGLQKLFQHFPMPANEDEIEASIPDNGSTLSTAPVTRKSSKRSAASGHDAMDVDEKVEGSIELRDVERCTQCTESNLEICITSIKGTSKKQNTGACVRCYEKKIKCSLAPGKGAATKKDLDDAVADMKKFIREELRTLAADLTKQNKAARSTFPSA